MKVSECPICECEYLGEGSVCISERGVITIHS